jgi:hypothetical protein
MGQGINLPLIWFVAKQLRMVSKDPSSVVGEGGDGKGNIFTGLKFPVSQCMLGEELCFTTKSCVSFRSPPSWRPALSVLSKDCQAGWLTYRIYSQFERERERSGETLWPGKGDLLMGSWWTYMHYVSNIIVTCWRDLQEEVWIAWLDLLQLIHSQFETTGNYSAIAVPHTHFPPYHCTRFSVFTSGILATGYNRLTVVFKSHMESSFHSLISFLPLFCNCHFRRLDSVQYLCSQAHISAGWRPETQFFAFRLLCVLPDTSLWLLCMDHAENTASVFKKACLLIRCLAIDVLSLCIGSHWNVFTQSLSSSGSVRHIIFMMTNINS